MSAAISRIRRWTVSGLIRTLATRDVDIGQNSGRAGAAAGDARRGGKRSTDEAVRHHHRSRRAAAGAGRHGAPAARRPRHAARAGHAARPRVIVVVRDDDGGRGRRRWRPRPTSAAWRSGTRPLGPGRSSAPWSPTCAAAASRSTISAPTRRTRWTIPDTRGTRRAGRRARRSRRRHRHRRRRPGSAIVANKVPGVRAAMCTTPTLARYSREHNGANVLALGATLLDRRRGAGDRGPVAGHADDRAALHPAAGEGAAVETSAPVAQEDGTRRLATPDRCRSDCVETHHRGGSSQARSAPRAPWRPRPATRCAVPQRALRVLPRAPARRHRRRRRAPRPARQRARRRRGGDDRPHAAEARGHARRDRGAVPRGRWSSTSRRCASTRPGWRWRPRACAASGVGVCSVVGFPLGATTPDAKHYETRRAIFDGATEIDMVINVGALKSGDLRWVGARHRGRHRSPAARPASSAR